MMMIYGMFVFELRTLPHQQLQQNKSWRHVKMNALTVQQAGSISVQVMIASFFLVCFILKLQVAKCRCRC
ncbi:hypothetical protein OHD05_04885 [Escherichia coli]|nr:hypothetical protein [Escherichia coli]MCW7306504.1 hypothetical protein [Escherichia coli]